MVRGNAGVQLFHAEGNRFTEQRVRLLGVQAERSERLDVGGQMGAAVANNHGVKRGKSPSDPLQRLDTLLRRWLSALVVACRALVPPLVPAA